MKKTKKLVATLGVLALPLFTGAWTVAPQTQQQETFAQKELVSVERAENDDSLSNISVYSVGEFQNKSDDEFRIGSSVMQYDFAIQQVSWSKTDRVNYEFKVVSGVGPQVRIKAMFFWGNDVIKPGGEIVHGPFTVGSNTYSGTLWCDHGGIPSGTGTSNKRWNCNFAVISFQVKLNSEVITVGPFALNFDDGGSDSFLSEGFVSNKLPSYENMLSPWDAWN